MTALAAQRPPSKPDLTSQPQRQPLRLALVGLGNELDGDDAAGVLVARRLMPLASPHRLILDVGPAPENFTGPLRRFAPDFVLLVDAAHLNQPPGTIAYVDWQDVDGLSASTHSLPPSVFANFLISQLNCQVGLLVVQAAHLQFDQPPSPAVQRAVQRITAGLTELLTQIPAA